MTLATFENAWRLATSIADDQQHDCAILRTDDPERPYVVAEYEGQPAVVVLITSDPLVGWRWISLGAKSMPTGG